MILSINVSSKEMSDFKSGFKRFFITDDVDNVFISDYIVISDFEDSMLFKVECLDKHNEMLREGAMVVGLCPCVIRTDEFGEVYHNHRPYDYEEYADNDLPFK